MSYGKERPAETWSDCSNRDFEEWYRAHGHSCLIEDQVNQVNCGFFNATNCGECTKDSASVALDHMLCQGDCTMEEGSCVPLKLAVPEWSPWGEWGSCSHTCGEGRRSRVRRWTRGALNQDIPFALDSEEDCPGTDSQTEACSLQPCQGELIGQTQSSSLALQQQKMQLNFLRNKNAQNFIKPMFFSHPPPKKTTIKIKNSRKIYFVQLCSPEEGSPKMAFCETQMIT